MIPKTLLGFPVVAKENGPDVGEIHLGGLTKEVAERAVKSLNMGDSNESVKVIRNHDWTQTQSGILHTIVELGVYRGATAGAFCKAFLDVQYRGFDSYAEFAADDPYRKSGDGCSKLTAEQQSDNMAAAQDAVAFAGERAHIFRLSAMEAAQMYGAKVSAVLHDSDHTYEAVSRELRAWYPKIEMGGLLMAHDYNHVREIKNKGFGVKKAVDEFAGEYGLDVNVIGTLAWMVVK